VPARRLHDRVAQREGGGHESEVRLREVQVLHDRRPRHSNIDPVEIRDQHHQPD
jgi:hypothetical protein